MKEGAAVTPAVTPRPTIQGDIAGQRDAEVRELTPSNPNEYFGVNKHIFHAGFRDPSRDFVNQNGDSVSPPSEDLVASIPFNTQKQLQRTMLPDKKSDTLIRPYAQALKDLGYNAYLQPNLFPRGENDRFLLTAYLPNGKPMTSADIQHILSNRIAAA